MIGVVQSTKPGIVVLKVRRVNVGISGVDIDSNIASGGVAVANVLVLQIPDKYFVDGQK